MKEGNVSWIIVAWTEDAEEYDGKPYAADLGNRPTTKQVKKAFSATWKRDGAPEDIAKALSFMKRDHPDTGRVYTYDKGEKDPLGRARKDILSGKKGE